MCWGKPLPLTPLPEVEGKNSFAKQTETCHAELVSASYNRNGDKPLSTWRQSHSKKIAFTLAEVLITLGIIGVVAALTMPALIAKYQEQQTVTELSKAYSTISQAWQMMQNEYGPIDTWGLESTNQGKTDPETGKPIYNTSAQSIIAQRLKQFLKVTKSCKINEVCHTIPSYTLKGEKTSDKYIITSESNSPAEVNYFLDDGTFVETGWYISSLKYGNMSVTIPSAKKRILGKTRFFFYYTSKGIIPEGTGNSADIFKNSSDTFENACNKEGGGRGCTAWVLYNRNMDYLHCPEKLGWNKKHSCK